MPADCSGFTAPDDDRSRWDAKYAAMPTATADSARLPAVFAPFAELFPTTGTALDLACGRGGAAVWLAGRGMDVWAMDVSPVALASAEALASMNGVAERCRFQTLDLGNGLPPGPAVDVVMCHKFREAALDQQIVGRLAPNGLLTVTALSEVGAEPGRFRIGPGELTGAFRALEVIGAGEGDGLAWLMARKTEVTNR
jgi:SAM-dependent methyltransferase